MEQLDEKFDRLAVGDSGQNTPIAAATRDAHIDENHGASDYHDVHWYYIHIRNANDYRVVNLLYKADVDPDDVIYAAWSDRVWAVISYCDHHLDVIEALRGYGFTVYSDDDLHRLCMVEVDNDNDFRLVGELEQCRECAKKGIYAPLVDCQDRHSAEKSA